MKTGVDRGKAIDHVILPIASYATSRRMQTLPVHPLGQVGVPKILNDEAHIHEDIVACNDDLPSGLFGEDSS